MKAMKLWGHKTNESPLKKIVEFVNAAQQGDFSVTLPVTSPGELGDLERAINRLVGELRDNRDRWEEQKAIQKELKISRVIQSTLLPSTLPDVPGVEILSLYRPAKQIGGDYYDFIEIDPNHLGIVIADVAGKSVSGAMLMTIIRNTIRSQAMLTLSPGEVLERTQRLLLPTMMSQFFVSVFYAVLDRRTKYMTCANAGHPPLLLLHAAENHCEWIKPGGMAIGLCRNGSKPLVKEEKEFPMMIGDLVFLYTDGITDVANREGRSFGREKLSEIAVGTAGRGAKEFLSALESQLASFSGDLSQGDDMTAVVLRRNL